MGIYVIKERSKDNLIALFRLLGTHFQRKKIYSNSMVFVLNSTTLNSNKDKVFKLKF